MRRVPRRALLLLLGVAAPLAGCGPSWKVVRQATPNPFVGQTRFALAAPSFEGVQVEGRAEAEWKGERNDETRASWEGDKRAMAQTFARTLTARAASGGIVVLTGEDPKLAPWTLKVRVVDVDPGFYAFVTARPSTVRASVQIVGADGAVHDEFTIQSVTVADMILASSSSRLLKDAERLGETAGDYLKARTLPPPSK